jgi:hypothetical protein
VSQRRRAEPAVTRVLPAYPITLPGVWDDDRGRDEIVVVNDGEYLRTRLRGFDLVSQWLDDFKPEPSPKDQFPFAVRDGSLTDGRLRLSMPIIVSVQGQSRVARLDVDLELGDRKENLRLTLDLGSAGTLQSCGGHGWFEDELVELVGSLPSDTDLVCCFTCGLSDYHPVGNPAFGGLACFRGAKELYRQWKGKAAVMRGWDKRTQWVQETHLCPEWESRPLQRGYRWMTYHQGPLPDSPRIAPFCQRPPS